MQEIWEYINEEKLYQVSNLGIVKRCARFIKGKKNSHVKEKLMKIKKGRYVAILISKKQVQVLIDRLVAKHFVPNPNNFKYIDHINKILSDNRCENLEWVKNIPKARTRICSDCKIEKDIEKDFYKWKSNSSGKRFICKECESVRGKRYRQANPEKEKIRRRNKYLRRKNAEIKKDSEYKKRRSLEDPSYKLLRSLRDRHSKAVKNAGANKSFRTTDLLGCDAKFLKSYFESLFKDDMNWSNYGTLWNIDHIYPLSKVDWQNKEQVAMVCSYKNLMPQYVWVNSRKRAKLDYYQ